MKLELPDWGFAEWFMYGALVLVFLFICTIPFLIYASVESSRMFAESCHNRGGVVLKAYKTEPVCVDPRMIK